MDTSKITNVLIFKEGFYYLTIGNPEIEKRLVLDDPNCGAWFEEKEEGYMIVPEEDWKKYGIERNGFEFPSDAYAYIAELQNETV